jgi:hypothetical protein
MARGPCIWEQLKHRLRATELCVLGTAVSLPRSVFPAFVSYFSQQRAADENENVLNRQLLESGMGNLVSD